MLMARCASPTRVVATILTYAKLVAGAERIATDATPGPGRWAEDLAHGHVAMALLPDWAIDDLRRVAPQLIGRLGLLSLPRFAPGDAPTASWGGTAVAIPRNAADPEAAWDALERLYLSDAAWEVRGRSSFILPAVMDWWPHVDRASSPEATDDVSSPHIAAGLPVVLSSTAQDHRQAGGYVGTGDPLDALFVGPPRRVTYSRLARQLPRRVVTPFTAMASSALSLVLYRATAALDAADDATLSTDVQRWLDKAAADLQSRIAFANLGS
jgi:hypothetical protein